MQNVALYARCASTQQGDTQIAEQLKSLRQFAKKNKYKIVSEYVDEGQSGSHLLRPALTKLRDDMTQGKFDTIVTKNVSRLSRQVNDHNILRSLFDEHNVKVVYTDDSPTATLMNSMYKVFSEYESKVRSDRVKRGIQRSKEQKNKNLPSLEAKERFLETK